jgi:hypothetical protein
LASQRVTVAKIGGAGAEVVLARFREWSATRLPDDPDCWIASEFFPADVRSQADAFAEVLRANALTPPVVHFVEYADLWSMGDVFDRWLSPPKGPKPFFVAANAYNLHAYELPDGRKLTKYLANAGRQQFDECNTYIRRLREAIHAWHKLVDCAVIVVLRHVIGGLVEDDEITASLQTVPPWLT